MQNIEDLPSIIQDLHIATIEALKKCSGLSEKEANQAAMDVSLKVCEKWGGLAVYIPKGNANKVIKRNKQIRLDFNGTNHQELCFKYKLSLVVIYKILKG